MRVEEIQAPYVEDDDILMEVFNTSWFQRAFVEFAVIYFGGGK